MMYIKKRRNKAGKINGRSFNLSVDYSRERDLIYLIFRCPIFVCHYIYFNLAGVYVTIQSALHGALISCFGNYINEWNKFITGFSGIVTVWTDIRKVTTEDGYILTLFRCNSRTATKNGEVVILQHGIVGSSDDWVMNIPSQSLAYIMADEGYDVWMSNFRGNFYSRHHEIKNPDTPFSGFWDFSYETIALFDNPAIYNYIRVVTGVSKFYAVGHSLGTTNLMVLLAKKPEYNDYFKAISSLAPFAYH